MKKSKEKRLNSRNTIRINDTVKIINPELFQRVGYPLCKTVVMQNMMTVDDITTIDDFIDSFNFQIYGLDKELVFDKIADAIAYGILVSEKFGGDERTIHTKTDEEYRGLRGTIVNRKVVKTGKYTGLCDGMPSLKHQETHVIYNILLYDTPYSDVWIEKKNIEKYLFV